MKKIALRSFIVPPLAGERWWRQPPKGEPPEWYMKCMTPLFFPHIPRFPLRGNASKRQKGVRGRAPIGCSIAVLTANRRPPERSDAQRTHFEGAERRTKCSESFSLWDATLLHNPWHPSGQRPDGCHRPLCAAGAGPFGNTGKHRPGPDPDPDRAERRLNPRKKL